MIDRPARRLHFSPWPILLTLMAVAMAAGVFAVTQSVQQREARVAELNRKLLSEQQTLRVLDAEWAYLTRPQRLESLLSMKTADAEMPPAPTPIAPVASAAAAVKVPEKAEPAAKPAKPEPVKKAEVKKTTKPAVKKVAAAPKKAAPKTASVDVWPIARKTPHAVAQQAAYPGRSMPRAGVARPIVE